MVVTYGIFEVVGNFWMQMRRLIPVLMLSTLRKLDAVFLVLCLCLSVRVSSDVVV